MRYEQEEEEEEGTLIYSIFHESTYQQPEIPEIRGDYAENLHDGCE